MTVALKAREAAGTVPRTVPGLKLWLDARRPGATLADGAAVATWYDLSGLGNNVVQATAAKKPVYRTSTTTGYLTLPGVAGNYASSPDSAALSVTGDIDIRVKCALTDWTPAAAMRLVSKLSTAGNYSYMLYVDATTGLLHLYASVDGTALISVTSSVAPTVADGVVKWVRVTRTASSGLILFFTSDDGTSWTPLGTDHTSTTGNLFDSNAALEVGSNNAGSGGCAAGKFYRAQILNGIDGTVVFDADFTTTGRSFVESSANAAVVTVNGTGARESVSTIPSIIFDGVDDVLSAAFTQAQPLTVYGVIRAGTPAVNSYWFCGDTNGASIGLASGAHRYHAGTGVNAGTATTDRVVLSAVFNGASSALILNGTSISTGNPNTGGIGSNFYIGGYGASSLLFAGTITAVLVYSGAHDANTRKKIERWLGRQYAVAVAQ